MWSKLKVIIVLYAVSVCIDVDVEICMLYVAHNRSVR